MKQNIVETILGAIVLVVAGFFIYISYESGNISSNQDHYTVTAKFNEVGNISIGTDVRLGGIKIGSVTDQYLDPKTYRAILALHINNDVKLPKDSSAAIVSDGLIGGKYISISPGAEERMIGENGEIKYTQDAINIEGLIGKFAFGGMENSNDDTSLDSDDDVLF